MDRGAKTKEVWSRPGPTVFLAHGQGEIEGRRDRETASRLINQRIRMGTPVWSHHGIVCTGEAYTKVVKLTFARGGQHPRPIAPLQFQQAYIAAMPGWKRDLIREGDELDEAQMVTWVKQAAALPGWVPVELSALPEREDGRRLPLRH
jgi:hypothetical protein